jgi:hypothetical protein
VTDRGVLLRRVSPWLPLGVGALSALAVVVQLPRIIAALYTNGDVASAPVIGALIAGAPSGRTVLLGQYPWYESLWMMQLTRSLPGHREIWEAAPILFTAGAYVLVVAATWWCFGRTRALLLAALLLSTTVGLRTVVFTLDFHGEVVVHACVLAVSLTVVLGAERLSGWAVAALAVLVGTFTAMGVASDEIVLIGALLPMLLTGLVLWARRPQPRERRAALFAVAVCVIAVLAGELAALAMRNDRIIPAPFPLSFVALGRVLANVEIFAGSFTNLAGGDFFGAKADGTGYLTLAAGLLALAALAAAARWMWRRVPEIGAPAPEEPARAAAGTAFVLFWSLLLVCSTAGFLLTSTPVDATSARYIATDFVAVAALLVCLAPLHRPIVHGALVGAITIFGALTLYFNVAHATGESSSYPTAKTVAEVEHYLLEHHATRGYAPYEDAADITWGSYLRIQAYPLERCTTPLGVCPMGLHQISTWYAPNGASTTFLLTDVSQVGNIPIPDPFGIPTAQAGFGPISVYIYNHDVATALQTPATP